MIKKYLYDVGIFVEETNLKRNISNSVFIEKYQLLENDKSNEVMEQRRSHGKEEKSKVLNLIEQLQDKMIDVEIEKEENEIILEELTDTMNDTKDKHNTLAQKIKTIEEKYEQNALNG